METTVTEIADRSYRLSTYVADVAPPAGFTFNQFLIDADEPLLFHCGHRAMFPAIGAALSRVMEPDRLRWIAFSHVEADECGAMNQWLAAARAATVVHGGTACMVSLADLADRAPRQLADGETLDLGGRRVRFLDTPHVPHGWEAGLIHEETTGTLFCSDLLAHLGDGPATTDADVVGPALAAEAAFRSMSLHPGTGPILRRLAGLAPRRLALMHGSSYTGDGAAALRALADHCEGAMRRAAA